MIQFEICKNTEIRKWRTPSKWKQDPEYLPITKISMTCGGGLGGSHWDEYVCRVDDIPANEMKKFTRYDGKEIVLNTSYIVKAENFKLAKLVLDVSEWAKLEPCYGDEKEEEVSYVLIEDADEITLI